MAAQRLIQWQCYTFGQLSKIQANDCLPRLSFPGTGAKLSHLPFHKKGTKLIRTLFDLSTENKIKKKIKRIQISSASVRRTRNRIVAPIAIPFGQYHNIRRDTQKWCHGKFDDEINNIYCHNRARE